MSKFTNRLTLSGVIVEGPIEVSNPQFPDKHPLAFVLGTITPTNQMPLYIDCVTDVQGDRELALGTVIMAQGVLAKMEGTTIFHVLEFEINEEDSIETEKALGLKAMAKKLAKEAEPPVFPFIINKGARA